MNVCSSRDGVHESGRIAPVTGLQRKAGKRRAGPNRRGRSGRCVQEPAGPVPTLPRGQRCRRRPGGGGPPAACRACAAQRRPRNCAGAVRPALRGGASLRRAQGWRKTPAGIGRGSASGRPPRRARRRVRAAQPAGWRGGGAGASVASLPPSAAGTARRPPAP